MGWMHDFTEYMKLDPYFRKNAHHMMTFSMEYAYSENYILVLSHDEVVHLKCSMLNKMPGEGFDKYANLKAAYAFMTGHPGKKLLFMGQEFAQLREWSEERELDWFLLSEEPHQQIQNLFLGRALIHQTIRQHMADLLKLAVHLIVSVDYLLCQIQIIGSQHILSVFIVAAVHSPPAVHGISCTANGILQIHNACAF